MSATNYAYQRIISSPDSYPMIKDGQVRPSGSYFSKYHGIVIQSETSYAAYVVSLYRAIAKGGISIWFYKNSNTVTRTLFSGWESVQETVFRLDVGSSLLFYIGGSSYADSSTVPPQQWNHLLVLWELGSASSTVLFILNGVTTGTLTPAAGYIATSGSTTRVVIGAAMDASKALLTGTTFDGYVRRVEALDLVPLIGSVSTMQAGLTRMAARFLASGEFAT